MNLILKANGCEHGMLNLDPVKNCDSLVKPLSRITHKSFSCWKIWRCVLLKGDLNSHILTHLLVNVSLWVFLKILKVFLSQIRMEVHLPDLIKLFPKSSWCVGMYACMNIQNRVRLGEMSFYNTPHAVKLTKWFPPSFYVFFNPKRTNSNFIEREEKFLTGKNSIALNFTSTHSKLFDSPGFPPQI